MFEKMKDILGALLVALWFICGWGGIMYLVCLALGIHPIWVLVSFFMIAFAAFLATL